MSKRSWHLGNLGKTVFAIALVAIVVVSAFALMEAQNKQPILGPPDSDPTSSPTSSPTGNPSPTMQTTPSPDMTTAPTSEPTIQPTTGSGVGGGLIESDPKMTSSTWRSIGARAWNYFQVGRGVDSTTGLPASNLGWNYFTDWDLGVYVQAIMDAQKVGLIGTDGDWGSHARLDKVITFLETRQLQDGAIPYWFYSAGDKSGYRTHSEIDVADSGTLLAALNNVKGFDSSFTSRIDNFVYNRATSDAVHNSNGRTNYEALVPSLKAESATSTRIYAYYVISGFAYFFSDLNGAPDNVLNNIKNAGTVTSYDVALPKGKITCEPLLYSVFNLRYSSNYNSYLNTLMDQIYNAHEAMYRATGKYVAFSEGIGPNSVFIWEWVVQPNGDVWKVAKDDGSYLDINPVIYTKASLSFLALHNTPFAYNMAVYLEKVSGDTSNGYNAGADYNQNINSANVYRYIDSNTNGLILSAARYALGS